MEGILKYQPKGPYALMGLCFGGTLAFEITKRLEAMGEEVAFCGGIDNPPNINSILWRKTTRQFFIDLLHFHAILTEEEAAALEVNMADVSQKQKMQSFLESTFLNDNRFLTTTSWMQCSGASRMAR